MRHTSAISLLFCLAVGMPLTGTPAAPARAQAAADVIYRVEFPAPEHHWMDVEVVFVDLPRAPLRVRMSRSSPGRYAAHDFAKNVFSFVAFDGTGRALDPDRTASDEWTMSGHDGTVRVRYRIFGDHADGTYLGIDTTHAHLNMPAAFVWAVGLEDRPVRITFVPPSASEWRVATQLMATSSPWIFTAPNLQYFMDSPTELAALVSSSFTATDPTGRPASFSIAAHAAVTESELDALAADTARLVREQAAVFGEWPAFDDGRYTFLLDGMPWTFDDAMEHRNSTMVTAPGLTLNAPSGRQRALSSFSHEFFHAWNVERLRPADLEPFDFSQPNVSCCLWLAEGFTQYYGILLLHRAGLADALPLGVIEPVVNGSGRVVRSPVEMSRYAPFADAAVSIDATDRDRTFISYYTAGAAIALGLDLSVREWSNGAVTLDDYMRRLWTRFGRIPADRPGYVTRPYTIADLQATLSDLTSPAFAEDFFARFILGREVPDFARLVRLAGFVLRPAAPDQGWIGSVPVSEARGGLLVGLDAAGGRTSTAFNTPLYVAGVDTGDLIVSIDGAPATRAAWNEIARRPPGTDISMTVRRRDGREDVRRVRVAPNPDLDVLPLDATGVSLSAAQIAFRREWLGSKVQ